MSHEALGTDYCPNCAIMKEKIYQLQQWEESLQKQQEELEREIEFIRKNKIY